MRGNRARRGHLGWGLVVTLRVRSACRADVAACLSISNLDAVSGYSNFALAPEKIDDWLAAFDEARPWCVADLDGEIVGFARGSQFRGRAGYSFTTEVGVYVAPVAQGKGVGRAIYDELLPALRAAEYHTAIACIALPNDASVALHEACGFSYVGTFREVGRKFDQWWDVGFWERRLEA